MGGVRGDFVLGQRFDLYPCPAAGQIILNYYAYLTIVKLS
jgi:hypothetical protein